MKMRIGIGALIGALVGLLAFLTTAPAPAQAPMRMFGTNSTTGAAAAILVTGGSMNVSQTGVINGFAAQSATGQTAAYDTGVVGSHSIQLVVTGAPATCTYRLQGSNDNSNWFNVSASDITCTSTTQSYEQNKPARYVRGNLLTLTGGTAPTVTLYYAGSGK